MTESPAKQGNSTSSVLGRRLGGELTGLRTAAGLTQPQAAQALTASTAKVAKLERGWVPVRDPDIHALCKLYGVEGTDTERSLLDLARVDRERRKAKGWWNNHPELGEMQEYVALENAATVIRTWQLCFVPGLLQTPAYARALASGNSLHGHSDNGDRLVATRMARQQRLDDEPPLELKAVIHEAALRHLVGGTPTMREQLDHLGEVARKPHVNVNVIPFSHGEHVGMGGSFNILSFAVPGAMDVVYAETALGQFWTEGGEGAAAHEALFERLVRSALSERESTAYIRSLSKEL
ncbi:helix-turn-helix domain-containing protein [Streptomyces xinghaiensis]|uniref:helix-turn-helix domain-containing protein n=1 Tax=Streptomyces xinghaiensis TaxID=1038928 RepID=UPI0002FF1EFB|nr:helix-turn-helix transcriptional regulator [Streptomyces xinghaiensis]MZE78471.1 helix-turn-helix domain-containing protein [Streptomyces sp. SID5475]